MTLNAHTAVMVPLGSLALGPVPAAGFGEVVGQVGAGFPARVEGVVVLVQPVQTGVIHVRVSVQQARVSGQPSFSVVMTVLAFDLVLYNNSLLFHCVVQVLF